MTAPTFAHFTDARRTVNLAAITSIDHHAPLPNGRTGTRVTLACGSAVTLASEHDIACLEDALKHCSLRVNATGKAGKQ